MIRHPALNEPGVRALRLRRARPVATALALALLGHAALLARWQLPAIAIAQAMPPAALRVRLHRDAAPERVQAMGAPAAPSPHPPARPIRLPEDPAAERNTSEAEPARPAALLHLLPPQSWFYRLVERGQQGQALLHWQVDADSGHYTLRLERSLPGRPATAWLSSGRFDAAAGLQPERFVTLRQGRERQAANFRREQGLLSYSASAELLPLPAGAQDRLSLWLQLAALAQAHPLHAGLALEMPVAGLRGAELPRWRFVVEAEEWLALPGREAPLQAWRLAGSPEGSPEQRLELWLAPALENLPVRLRWSWEGQESSELLLHSAAQP